MKITINDKDYSWIGNLIWVILGLVLLYLVYTDQDCLKTWALLAGVAIGGIVTDDLIPLIEHLFKKLK